MENQEKQNNVQELIDEESKDLYMDYLNKFVEYGRELRRNPHGHAATYLAHGSYEIRSWEDRQKVFRNCASFAKRKVVRKEGKLLRDVCQDMADLIDNTECNFDHIPEFLRLKMGDVLSGTIKTALDKGLVAPSMFLVNNLAELSKRGIVDFAGLEDNKILPQDLFIRFGKACSIGARKGVNPYSFVYDDSTLSLDETYKADLSCMFRNIQVKGIYSYDIRENNKLVEKLRNSFNHDMQSHSNPTGKEMDDYDIMVDDYIKDIRI